MRSLSANDLVSLWEQGYGLPLAQKAMLMIAGAWPEISKDQAAAIPIGERDGRLLALREQLFGSRFESTSSCPECGDLLEFYFQIAELQLNGKTAVSGPLSLELDDYQVQFRLPNTQDLLALVSTPNIADSQKQLLEKCLIEVQYRGKSEKMAVLPGHVIQSINNKMAAADPLADIQLQLNCPSCEHQWSVHFDIISYLWQEIHDWAIRTVRDVHVLASTYGWSEQDILNMSVWRRQLYLQMTMN